MRALLFLIIFGLIVTRGVEISALVVSLSLLVALSSKSTVNVEKIWVVFLISCCFFLEESATLYGFLRDVLYFAVPFGLIWAGEVWSRIDPNLVKKIVFVSVCFSIFYLCNWRFPSNYDSFYLWQQDHGSLPLGLFFILVVLAGTNRISQRQKLVIYVANLAVLSRFVMLGFLMREAWRSRLMRVVLGTVTIVTIVFVAPDVVADRSTFLGKVFSSFTELTSEVDATNIGDLHGQWRGYELAVFLQKLAQSDPIHFIVGFGYGSLVDLGLEWRLDSQVVSAIPRMHNAFSTVFLKGGLFGLISYLIVLKAMVYRATEIRALRLLLLTLLLLQSLVFAGLFSPEMSLFLFLLGALKNDK